MQFNDIKQRVEMGVSLLFENEMNLLRPRREWAISSKLGMYLHSLFPQWNVDCEYNKIGDEDEPKRGASSDCIRPDIVIHHRTRKPFMNNLLYIEVKFKNGLYEDDYKKLIEFTSPPVHPRVIQYQFGLSLTVHPDANFIWFQNGEIIESNIGNANV